MIKLLCFPLTKLFLFFGGFIATIFALRAINLTFDRLIAFALHTDGILQRPVYEGVSYGRGFWGFAFLFFLCVGLLLFSVWKTKPNTQEIKPLALWRNIDFALLIILTTVTVLISYFGLRYYLMTYATSLPQILWAFGLPLLAYTTVMFTVTELVARMRDKDLLRTLYWFHFFRLYPIWKPLGLLLLLLLLGSLIVLLLTMQDIFRQATFDLQGLGFRVFLVPPVVSVELLLAFSLLALVSTTYFVTFALNLSDKYAAASDATVRAERFKSELITNVSHDIRTPLTTVINYVDLLKKLSLEGAAAEYVSVLDRKSDRLKMLIDDLIDASKAGTGNEDILMQTVNLSEIAGQIAGELEDDFTARNVSLVLVQPDEPVFVSADNRHLWRVLENLFSNASKYSLPGTRVFAEIALDHKGKATIHLKNTSETPLDLPGDVLTEQFIRGDRARQSDGSGLGLYIAKNLVELQGGQFEIQVIGDLFIIEITFSDDKKSTMPL